MYIARGGQANFFLIANPQILGLVPLSQIRKLLRCASLQFVNPQISTKYCTTLSQSSPKISILITIFLKFCTNLNKSHIGYICKEKKYVFADFRKSAKNLKSAYRNSTNCVLIRKSQKRNRSANRKSAKCHISEWSANYLSLQICGFAICEMYLRTAHLCTYIYIQYSPTYQLP